MSLGYALLHPHRLEAALLARSQKQGFDIGYDIACGALSIGDLGAEIEALIARQGSAIEDLAGRLDELVSPGRPLAFLKAFGELDLSSPEAIFAPLGRLLDFLETAEGPQIRVTILPVVDGLLDAAPSLDLEVVSTWATARLDEIVDLLKTPLRRGRKDVAAVQAYRAAMSIRCMLDPLYLRIEALGRINLRAMIREAITLVLGRLDGLDLAPLRLAIRNLRAEFGGLAEAILHCSGSATVGGGVELMAEPAPSFLDEMKAVPHTRFGEDLSILDFSTNLASLFNLIWEFNRTRAIKGRPFDATVLVLGFLWQAMRTAFRAVPSLADKINLAQTDGTASKADRLTNWLFTDQADFVMQLFMRAWIPVVYENCAGTNMALMLAARWLQFVANTFNVRLWYQYMRSMWYFKEWKAENKRRQDAGEPKLEKISFNRFFMGLWPFVWVVSSLMGGIIMPWDDFQIEDWGGGIYFFLFFIPLVMWFIGYIPIGDLTGVGYRGVFGLEASPDFITLLAIFIPMLLLGIAVIGVSTGIESEDQGAALGGSVAIIILFTGLLAFLAISWLAADSSATAPSKVIAWATQLISLIFSVVIGVIAAVVWWFTIDDGRDKHGAYDDLEVDDTPYLLPYPKDENWFCGQGFHGLFSHKPSSPGNHFAYDLNECPGKAALASRTGIVVDVVQGNPDDQDEPNLVRVMHSTPVAGIDPGETDENALTYTEYVHAREAGVHARSGQVVPQGVHLIDIDSTGRSAQHHVHIGVVTGQIERPDPDNPGGVIQEQESIPFLFKDGSVREYRNYFLLSWLPGKHATDGKPISFAFYVSDNDRKPPHPAATTVPTDAADVDVGGAAVSHFHRIFIDRALLSGDAVPASITARTSVDAGHFHTVTLDGAALESVFRLERPNVETADQFGHRHALAAPDRYQTINYPSTEAVVSVTGTDGAHSHDFTLGTAYLEGNVVPPGGTAFTLSVFNVIDPATGAVTHTHSHTATIEADALARSQGIGTPEVTTSDAFGHTHKLRRTIGQSASAGGMAVTVVQPPAAQLQARRTAPYDVLGERVIVRVNDRATEWHLYAGERSRVAADIAIDYGLFPANAFDVGGTGLTIAAGVVRHSARGTARQLSTLLRAPTPAGAPTRTVAVRAEPVIVIETRRRGRAARLERLAATTLVHALLPIGSPALANGSGAFDDLAAVPRAALAAHIDTILQNGWPAPPAPVAATLPGGRLGLTIGGAAPNFAGSAARLARVAGALFDAAANQFRTNGPMPLSTGRLALRADYDIPILARPAQLRVPPPAVGTAIIVMVHGEQTTIATASADAVQLARQFMREVEGVRAWQEGGEVVLQGVGAGASGGLAITIGAGALIGASGADPDGLPIGDSTGIAPDRLRGVIADAVARSTLPAPVVAANPRAQVVGEAIRMNVNAAATIAVTDVDFTGPNNPLPLVSPQAATHTVFTQPLPATLRFDGPAWIDLQIEASDIVRIPIDGEPARLDLLPTRLPANGERFDLAVNGAAVSIVFDGTEQSVAAIVERIAAASSDITVRIAHRLAVEDMLYRGGADSLDLADANGLALAGFLGPRPVAAGDRLGRGGDMLALPGALPGAEREQGSVLSAFTIRRGAAPGGERFFAEPSNPGFSIIAAVDPAPDPLGFAPAPPASVQSGTLAGPVNLGGHGRHYAFTVRDAGLRTVAVGHAQLAAEPAIARAVRRAQLPPPGAPTLVLEVVEPGGAVRTANVDLSGAADADDIAERINTAVPHVRAWVAEIPEALGAPTLDRRLHIETVGGGNAWRLRFGDLQTAAALGFPLDTIDGDRVVFSGRGTVADGAAATLDEIEAALNEAVQSATGSFLPTGGTRVSVSVVAGRIELRSGEGQVDLETEPPSLLAMLSAVVQPNVTTIGPSPPVPIALDSGRVLLRAGGRGLAAVEIFGAPAEIRANDPIPVAQATPGADDPFLKNLELLKLHRIILRINTTLRLLPLVPDAVATLEDAVEFLAGASDPAAGWNGDDWWIGLVDDAPPAGALRCVIQTIRRGSNASIAIDFANFGTDFPSFGILGFTATLTSDLGVGNLPDLDAVPVTGAVNSLQQLFRQAALRGGSRQAVYTASDDAGTLRLRANLETVTLQQMSLVGQPGGVVLAAVPPAVLPSPLIEAAYAGLRAIEPGVMEIESDEVPGAAPNPRRVRSLFHGEPARLRDLLLPAALPVLNGRALRLRVGADVAQHPIVADAATTPLSLGRQLERKFGWRIRVRLRTGPSRFEIETVDRGGNAALELLAAVAAPDAVTGNAATGFVPPAPLPILAAGNGSAGSLLGVDAATYARILQNGMIAERTDIDQVDGGRPVGVNGSAYDAPEVDRTDTTLPVRPLNRIYARLLSQRTGGASSVVLLPLRDAAGAVTLAGSPVFDFERSLERAPAVRAALRIPPFARRPLSGRLHIQLNENGGGAGLPPGQTIVVDVPAREYEPADLARLIHNSLFDGGAGAAQVYADGSIMVETGAAGLAGTVRIPAAGTPAAGVDRDLVNALLPAGSPDFVRGWPSAGRTPPGNVLFPGFRSRAGAATGGASWVFADGVGRSATIAVAAGDTLDAIATALDAALANGVDPTNAIPPARIGHAALGGDGALYVEGFDAGFTFVTPPSVNEPTRLGRSPERAEEPAVGWRRTHEARTTRIVRDRNGHGVLAEHDDLGWVRLPASNQTGDLRPFLGMPAGRYLAAVRTDAAKTHGYDAESEMIAFATTDPADPERHLVLSARYWLAWGRSTVFRIVRHIDDRFYVALERAMR